MSEEAPESHANEEGRGKGRLPFGVRVTTTCDYGGNGETLITEKLAMSHFSSLRAGLGDGTKTFDGST